MKKIIILVAVALTITGTLIAQNKATHQRKTRAQAQQSTAAYSQATVDRMSRELNLSAEQQKQVYNLTLASNKESLRTKEGVAKYNADLNQILNADQKATLDRLKAEKIQQKDVRSAERHNDLKSAPVKVTGPEKI
ncbi:hypothetical protein DBR32_08300 [Taibaiella sp. KBW10]|uniref:hypothetical protein n=1 Tax=Taibaiella sp. KBW10 TaxID=2153357 RepID=UPI000F5B0D0B|nr:hypothetical protein [Taibaiella sp. KBW10]RQO30721.1 hypothetical protein DBR32_08300 [Taibaiella sp. KBW10]